MSRLSDALDRLQKAREASSACLVAFSGGKDSLATLDLCSRTFDRVVPFVMELVPGLQCVDELLEAAERRWSVEILRYPHWLISRYIAHETYMPRHWSLDDLPVLTVGDIYRVAQHDTGIRLLATGAKAADSMWRRRTMAANRLDGVFHPLQRWKKLDVLQHLKARGIPLPPSSGGRATGIDLSTKSLLWLHDTFPEDFRRLCEVFPFAEAAVWRRRFHGPTAHLVPSLRGDRDRKVPDQERAL